MKTTMKILLSTVGAMIALPASAQDVPTAPSDEGIGEIIVTATRRSESAITVPISITAFDQSQLDRRSIKDVGDLARSAR